MGGKSFQTQKLPYEQNIEYQEWRPSETDDTRALRAMSAMPETLAPALQSQYDRAQEQSAQRWNSAYGGNVPEVARRAMQGQEQRGFQQDYGSAMGQAAFDANNTNYNRRLALAEMTLGRPLQSRSSGYQSQQKQGSGFWSGLGGSLVSAGAMVGIAA